MLIIPSIDILNNKIVRLQKGDFDKVTTYATTVFEQAQMFDEMGVKRIHIVDLKGSKSGEMRIISELKRIKNYTNLKIQVGGGIRSYADIQKLAAEGLDYFVIGSLSILDKPLFEKIVRDFGPDKIIGAADIRNDKVRISGWTEETEVTIDEHLDYFSSLGLRQFLCTDIEKDGLLLGTNLNLYSRLKKRYPKAFIIASGGISSNKEINEIKTAGIDAAVIGRAYYEGKINLKEAM